MVVKSFNLKNQKMTQTLGKTFGLFKDTSFIVIRLNREFNFRAERRIIPHFTRFIILNETASETKHAMRGVVVIGEKPRHLRQKQIQLC